MTEIHSISRRSIRFGNKRIHFELRASDRKTLGIEVHPDQSVVAIAPNGSSDEAIDEKILKRASWILKQQQDFEAFLPILPAHKYTSGESFRYLGRQYKLRIFKARTERVRMQRGQIQVSLPDRTDTATVKTMLDAWFRHRAELVIAELWPKCVAKVERHGIEAKTYQLRKMKTRWGSCGKNGIILLNPELISAPKQCIEYLIIHELCHLKHYNHGAEFFELLSVLVPDWEVKREKLNIGVRND
jgi:predicted metal-dependent hydrolase